MKNKCLIIFVIFICFTGILYAQENENPGGRFRFISGIGPMNLVEYESMGIQLNNSFEFEAKNWLLISANLHIGKSGNNKTDYTYFTYFPDFPENVETNFVATDLKNSRMNSFSSIGVFALLNPFGKNKTRLVFGPGLCFMSWEEMTTVFYKGFNDYEYYEISSRIRNSKKADFAVRASLEHSVYKNIFVGINLQGYVGIESASSVSAIIGFRL